MADLDKVIKGLECCMKWTGEPDTAICHCSDCSYTNMDIFGQRCLIDLINDALVTLKEPNYSKNPNSSKRPDVVRCKDCEHGYRCKNAAGEDCVECSNHYVSLESICRKPDWFCADGEHKNIRKPVSTSATDYDGINCE